MKFSHFQKVSQGLLEQMQAHTSAAGYAQEPAQMHPLVLAHIGDAWFSLYVRCRLLAYGQLQVRILHAFSSRLISAVSQAAALRTVQSVLTREEEDWVRRGRNANSTVPKSATVAEYRASTGFECLLGYLYLTGQQERLEELAEQAYQGMVQVLTQ